MSKISKGLGVLRKARKMFKRSTLVTLYYSLKYPYIMYGVVVWGTAAGDILMQWILRRQTTAVRLITMSPIEQLRSNCFTALIFYKYIKRIYAVLINDVHIPYPPVTGYV